MMAQKYPYRLFRVVANTPLALETFGLTLVPEDGEPIFEFQAGQWVGVQLPHDIIPNRRNVAFSIASAPIESTHAIELAIKMYGSFSRMLQMLNLGDHVSLQGPFGIFVLKPMGDRAIFFAGGIGITPLRSMIRQLLFSNDPREILLFYSNRTRQGIAYEDELRELAKKYKNFHPFFFLTGEAQDGWDGEFGRVTDTLFDRYAQNISMSEFYLCGPRPFMDAIVQILVEHGVDLKNRVHRESFG